MEDVRAHIFANYLQSNNGRIQYLGADAHVADAFKFWNYLVPYDHPDSYAVIGNEALILEHFEFDSSDNSIRKGSQQRRSEADANRAFNAIIPSEKGAIFHSTISANYTIENYRQNLTQVFIKHRAEIPAYRNTLIEAGVISPSHKIATMFFIEDKTILGNLYETGEDSQPVSKLVPFVCDFFLDLFDDSPEVDYILFGDISQRNDGLLYIDHGIVADYRQKMICADQIQIINFNPQQIGARFLVTDEELNRNSTSYDALQQ